LASLKIFPHYSNLIFFEGKRGVRMKLEVEKGNAESERSHTQSKRPLAHARNIDISQIT